MQTFPLFMSLQGRRVLVVGGTDHAARKVELRCRRARKCR